MTAIQRRLDHLVLAVRDLDAAATFYARLGFQVGGRNRHPWGTENRLVQFGSSFLKLITVAGDPALIPPHGDDRFSFGAFVRDYLDEREGLAMLALDSADAEADAKAFAEVGMGRFEPFHFERKGRRVDGGETRVAFSLAFASMGSRGFSFFVCQQHVPEAFWNPAFQRHANGALDVGAVSLTAPAPESQARFATAFTGSPATPTVDGLSFGLRGGGRLDVVRGEGEPALTAFSVRVPDLDGQRRLLEDAGLPFRAADGRVMIASRDAFGVEVAFEAGSAGPALGRSNLSDHAP